jgi:5-methyltetrahydropteroyltriglutamate--homocysteine methyltransferase
MRTEILITQEIGSFRKPQYLSSVFRKAPDKELTKLKEKATLETLEMFNRAGLDNTGVAGEMYRWEMYEHVAASLKGIEFYGPVRSFDNRYYRKGSVVSPIERKNSFHDDELNFIMSNSTRKIKLPITGPYTMADWSFNEHFRDKGELALAFAEILNEEIRHLYSLWSKSRSDVFEVQIDEPAATTHPSEMDLVVESVNRSIEGIHGCEFSIHVCYSTDYRMLFEKGSELKLQGYNLEFANRDTNELGTDSDHRKAFEELKSYWDIDSTKFIGIGVTDVHIDYIEPVQLIKDRIKYAIAGISDPAMIRVNPDCGLRTRSREVGYAKLRNMVDAVKEIRKEY